MTDMATRAQITMLAQLLDARPEDFTGLDRLGVDQVEALRKLLSDALFDSLATVFTRVSKLAPLVPDALAATVAVKAIPPEVAGRAGGAVGLDHQHRAASLLARLNPGYLADAAPYIDPRVIPVFAPKLPFHLLIPTADELLRRRDYLTAARFVEYATEELVRDFERHVQDDAAILLTAAMVSRTAVLDTILRAVAPERRERLIDVAANGAPDVLAAALSLLSRVHSEFAAPMSRMLLDSNGRHDAARVAERAVAAGATPELLDILEYLTDDTVRLLAGSEGLLDKVEACHASATPRRRTAATRLRVVVPDEATH